MNATYKAAGHSEDIYMVGEQWNEPNLVTPYYKGLNAFFEFASWYREYGDQKILVIHNFSSQATVTLANNGNLICSNGKAELSGTRLTIGQYSSAIILIK